MEIDGLTFDVVDIRPLHQSEKLPGICGEAFDIASLAFRVDRIEGEARLPGAREARDDDEPVPRHLDIDILQVVDACAPYDQLVVAHWLKTNSSISIRNCSTFLYERLRRSRMSIIQLCK